MVIAFWPDVAPNTVANFKTPRRMAYATATLFHRIVKGFMIQGGDPNTKKPESPDNSMGHGRLGHDIKAEFNEKHHEFGVISMARSMDPDSASRPVFRLPR